jgi:N-methylhydantoinase B
MVKEYRFLETEASLQVRADRQTIRPYGLAGGAAGAPGANLLARAEAASGAASGADPAWARLPAKALLTLHRGDLFRHVLPGAGGWGDPWRRDPSLVLEDVVQEKVTATRAGADYGVVLCRGAGDALEVDDVATARRRSGERPPGGMLGG